MLKRDVLFQLRPTAFSRVAVVCLMLLLLCAAPALSQEVIREGQSEVDALRSRASQLMQESRLTEALPVLEKLSKALPNDAETAFYLGFARFTSAKMLKGAPARKEARALAYAELVHARELGFKHPLLNSILQSLPPDGGGEDVYSANAEADETMREAEAAFVQGHLDDAIAAYGRALKLDPKLYMAALFTGDAYVKKEQSERADEWFARAIEINPDIETAYRYWATGLTARGKTMEARDKYIEAFITEPYNSLARAGLVQWAQRNNFNLAHPRIDIPTNVSSSAQGQINITLDESSLKNKSDGSSAWMMYGIARAGWMVNKDGKNEKFSKQYPNEKAYRHSLAEEVDALRLVLESVSTQMKEKRIKRLDPSLDNLMRLNDAGLLEAYILLARPDDGIAQDFAAYRKTNRDKLRRYVLEFVLSTNGDPKQ
jgi:tetratricopeptide (TPR) repeat protein